MKNFEITSNLNLAELGAHRSYNFEWFCKEISNHSLASLRIQRSWGSFSQEYTDGSWEVEIRSTSSAYDLESSGAVLECLLQARAAAQGIDFEKVEVDFQAAEIIRRERSAIRAAEEKAAKEAAEAADPAFGEDRVKAELATAIKAFRDHEAVKSVLITRVVRSSSQVELFRLDFSGYGRNVTVTSFEVRGTDEGGKWVRVIDDKISQRDLKDMLARSSHTSAVKTFASYSDLEAFVKS